MNMINAVFVDSIEAIPSTAAPRLPRRLDYLSNKSEIIDLGLRVTQTDEDVEGPGLHDQDELTSAVRLSSPFCPTGSSSRVTSGYRLAISLMSQHRSKQTVLRARIRRRAGSGPIE